jgi:long-chain acyl-CoA synthetase
MMDNLVTLLDHRCSSDPEKNAFLVKRAGNWEPVTWGAVKEKTDRIAAGLLALGIGKGDAVCILGNTRLEWTLSDFGVLKCGGISIGIYQTLTGEQAAYILKDSEAKALFVEDSLQLEKIKPYLNALPDLKQVILWEGAPPLDGVVTLADIDAAGGKVLAANAGRVAAAAGNVDPQDTAIIIYTSGTTGPPKGACLSHANIMAELKAAGAVSSDLLGDIMMFFLPLAHVGERVAGQYMRLYRGVTAAYVGDILKILDDIKEIRPTFFGSVPRIFEKAYAKVRAEVETASPLKRSLFVWAEGVGRSVSRLKQAGKTPSLIVRLKYAVADRLVFSKIRDIFGGRCRYFLSSSAPIAVEILEFFHACGMLILEGYGQTEVSCFCTLCTPEDYRFGSVGKALPGVAMKIAGDGEIMVKGDIVFKGYHNQPELNKKTLTDDGWIYTGDIGRLDDDGFLWITGRKKEIIITSGGKNITPSNIETLIMNHPLIEHAMVHGDRRKYLTALISLSNETLLPWGEAKGHSGMGFEELVGLEAVRQEVQKSVDVANSKLAKYETVKRFVILPHPFTIETGELTPTMKVKRGVVEEKYMGLLDGLYA